MPAELRIDIIAETMANTAAMFDVSGGKWLEKADGGETVAVFAGRACYASWDRPNPKTADTKGYLSHILEVEHLSVLRHATVTLYIQGISRTCSHELIRHHVGIDFSQLSQRYVDATNMDYVIPPAMRGSEEAEDRLEQHWRASVRAYEAEVARLTVEGKTRKQAREAARAFLPNCTETKIVVTANIQAWRNFIQQRGGASADAEIRELAVAVAKIMKENCPSAFQDLVLDTLPDGREVAVF